MISSSSSVPDGTTPICCCTCECYEGQGGYRALLNGCNRAFDGTISPSTECVFGGGLGMPFSSKASYGNNPGGTGGGVATGPSMGPGWQSHDLAGLTFPAGGDEIYFKEGPNQMEVYVPSGIPNTWIGTYYVRSTIVKSGAVYTMTLKDGSRKTFASDGRITGLIGASGQSLAVSYSGGQVSTVAGSIGAASVEYSYSYESGRVKFITQSINGVEVRRTAYFYWSSGLLQKEVTQEKRGTAWLETETSFFTYHGGNTGLLHFILRDDALHRMSSIGLDPATATEAQITPYADSRYTYDIKSRLHTLASKGGAYVWSLEYENSGFGGGAPNEWTSKTTITRPDGSVETIYFNRAGSVLLSQVQALNSTATALETWYPVCQQFDAKARIVRDISAAAIATVDEGTAALFTVREHAGLIRGFSYADSQGGGYADEWVQEGSLGSPVLQRQHTYIERAAVGGPSIWLPSTDTTFLNEAGTATAVTSYAYTWLNEYQMASRTTTQPVVSASEHGTGMAGVIVETFDEIGFRTGLTDQSGMVTSYMPDLATGAVKQKTVDAGGLNLITDYVLDDQGRTVLEKGPLHPVDLAGTLTNIRTAQWTYYRDPEDQRITFPGFIIPGAIPAEDVGHCVGPVTVERGFVLPVSPDGTSFSATTVSPWELTRLPQPDDVYPQSSWVRWKSRRFSKGGELLGDRLYYLIPSTTEGAKNTNYAEATYAYDAAGMVNEVTTPGGTIQKTVFNAMGWMLSRLTGTGAGNLLTTVENQYDGNADKGDGLLTKSTTLVDGTPGNNSVTDFTYDWRQRQQTASASVVLTGSVTPVVLLIEKTYDNRNLITDVRKYRTSTAAGNLREWARTKFDAMGRTFQTLRYEVNASTGVVGNALTDNTWYDAAGRVLVQWPGGSQAFQSMMYNAAGWVKTAYTAYQPGWLSSSGMPDISQSIVMEEHGMDYDKAQNVLSTTFRQRYDDATGSGPLHDHGSTQPRARISYAASYPDTLGRTVAVANYGTNGLSTTPWSRPDLIPVCTDDVLVNLTAYNPTGEPYLTTDPILAQYTRTWDAAGRLTQELQGRVPGRTTPAIDRKTDYQYNPDGNVTKLTAWNNPASGIDVQETVWTYGVTTAGGSALNSNLLVATKTYPDSTGGSDVVTYTYNRSTQVTTMKDQSGLVHTYTYDSLGRQTRDEVTAWGSSTVDQTIKKLTTGYDDRGMVVLAESYGTGSAAKNSVALHYNGWRQLAQETQGHDGGTARSIVYGYETGASISNTIRRTSVTYPSGQTSAPVLNYHYGSTGTDHGNALSRVSSIKDGGTAIINYQYLGFSQFVDVNYPVPATHLSLGTSADNYAGLDRFGRPITIAWLLSGTALVKGQYRYDRGSNRQWRYDAAAQAAGVTTEDQWYEYDGLYQVSGFQRGTLVGTFPGFSGLTPVAQNEAWTYDALGNWLGYINDALNQTRQFNKVNEITTIAGPTGVISPLYDPTGNMTTMPAVDHWTTAQTLTWDAWNRLVKVTEDSTTIAEYTYDALFRRVTKTVSGNTRRFYYGDQWQILEEYTGSAANPEVRYWYGLYGINDISRRQRYSSGTTLQDDLYALRDTMNVVALVSASGGTVTQRMAYDAFGNTRFLTAAWAAGTNLADWNYLFHAHFNDAETGLYQMRLRYYQANLGIWLSRDPIAEKGGVNMYAFVGNSPLLHGDLYGLDQLDILADNFFPPAWTLTSAVKKMRDWQGHTRMDGNEYAANLMDAYLAKAPTYVATPREQAQVRRDLHNFANDLIADYLDNTSLDAPSNCPKTFAISSLTSTLFKPGGGSYPRANITALDSLNAYIYFGGADYKIVGTGTLLGTSGWIDCECDYRIDVEITWQDSFNFGNVGPGGIRLINHYYDAGNWLLTVGGFPAFPFEITYKDTFFWTAE